MQQPPNYPPPRQSNLFQQGWHWFRSRSRGIQIIIVGVIFILAVMAYGGISQANTSTDSSTPATQTLPTTDPSLATAAQASVVAQYNSDSTAAAQPTPTPKPTATPTPRPIVVRATPTAAPVRPTPTPKHCAGVNNNPWCYDFNPGNTITVPPSGFCNYFNCIPTFYGSDDPGDGYIIECQDGTYSQSGGESGACSYHGGEMRTLYSH